MKSLVTQLIHQYPVPGETWYHRLEKYLVRIHWIDGYQVEYKMQGRAETTKHQTVTGRLHMAVFTELFTLNS